MQKQSLRLLFAAPALVAVLSISMQAHHGWRGNSGQETELTGTLEAPVSLAGPHATMKIRVNGQVWDITLAPPARTERSGLKEGIIPLGATVTRAWPPERDGQPFRDEDGEGDLGRQGLQRVSRPPLT